MDPGPSSEPSQLSFEEAEEVLLGAPAIELLGLLPNSSNYTFLARLETPGVAGGEALAVYKPAQGESPLWDFPTGRSTAGRWPPTGWRASSAGR